jgi:HD-GYP domain-containing protein (c-di-GMP phosphodiesterase class II)
MSGNLVSISVDELAVGVSCSRPIVDEAEILLVGANTRITQHVISGLRDRGITSIEVDPRDVALLKGSKRTKLKSTAESRQSRAVMMIRPLREAMVDRFDEDLSPQRAEVLESNLTSATEQIELVRNQLCTQSLRSVSQLVGLSNQYVHTLVDDHDQTVGMLGRSEEDEELSRRSTRMSVLGMAVAAEMGLNGEKSIEVGLTGLLHDVGLMVMDRSMRQPYDWMSEDERWEYKKHPLVAAACVESMMEVPHNVSLAIAQLHEQFDGSGYPRGLQKTRIHPYARILNVVDSYLQLTSRTRHRPALVAHDAMAFLLHQAAKGMFDPDVIRAFLRTETLFPLGSQVELSNGEAATVIRRPRHGYSAPVVTDSDGKRIELEDARVQIIRPIVEQDSSAVRIDQDMMKEMEWTPLIPVFSGATA